MVWDTIRRLIAYRGIDRLGALTLAVEVCDWLRFASAHAHMAFCGLVPTETSSGASVRRGGITKTGNVHVRTQLIESAWAYRYPPKLTRAIAARQVDADPDTVARAWRAQLRLTPPLPSPGPHQTVHRRGRRRGPRARRVRMGRDDRMTLHVVAPPPVTAR